MPGIIDAHMHPFWGGATLAGCHLDYQSLSIDDILSRIQKYLDENFIDNDTEWLKVSAWYREGMQPEGVQMTRYHLDTLKTTRPILLFSSDCHSVLANSRALALLNITAETPDPLMEILNVIVIERLSVFLKMHLQCKLLIACHHSLKHKTYKSPVMFKND